MRAEDRIAFWGGVAVAGWFAFLVWTERRHALRRSVEPKLRRDVRNLAVAAIGSAVLMLAERPVVLPLSRWVQEREFGLVHWLGLPPGLRVAVSLLLMDYTLYAWHVMTHKWPFLWRMHKVHHCDLDLDASTAIRFHFAELACSVPYRAAQVLLIGTEPVAFALWQQFLFFCILFHHSNVRLPLRLEQGIQWLLVSPRLHGIHHSIEEDQVNSNWSSGLTVWDWLHGTLRTDVPQSQIITGVREYQDPAQVTLPRILRLPFVAESPRQQLAG